MTGAVSPSLPEDFLDRIDQQLGDTDTFLARCYPGEDARRQPVHTSTCPPTVIRRICRGSGGLQHGRS